MRHFFRQAVGIIIVVYLFIFSTAWADLRLEKGLWSSYPAPPIEGISAWINSPPLQLNTLKGKVVLIDFWTYSCINCIRTLPYLKDWYDKYHNAGLVIIGVHSPEFEFEKNLTNVKNAVAVDGIKYPVALDNQYVTWKNFKNQYWPTHYLINKKGEVVYVHAGEGEYDVTENNIRFLLGLTTPASSSLPEENRFPVVTPETYLGYARAANFSSPQAMQQNKSVVYAFPEELRDNEWALKGGWTVNADRVVSTQPYAGVKLHFNAQHIYIVMGSATGKPIEVRLLLNGEELVVGKGKDVTNSMMTVDKHKLYDVVALTHVDNGILEMIASSPGLEVYTFTFG